jgi:pimeloyl-ACP methyl ester carboxylesterase
MMVRAPDGVALHVIDQPPSAPQSEDDVVLWLQGLNAPASAWAVQLAHFGRTHRCIAPDGRGVGKSDAPPPPYSTRQLAEDARAVLDACGVRRAHVVGLSLGGAVGQELALAHPDRVRSLALLATFAKQAPRPRALIEAWRAIFPLAHEGPELRSAWEKQAYAWLFTDRFWRNEANVRAARRFAENQPLQSVQGYQGQCDAALAHDATARLANVRCPTAVIHGEIDQLAPVEGAKELAELIPGAGLTVVPEVGHAVNLEGQRAVHQALRALWGRA